MTGVLSETKDFVPLHPVAMLNLTKVGEIKRTNIRERGLKKAPCLHWMNFIVSLAILTI